MASICFSTTLSHISNSPSSSSNSRLLPYEFHRPLATNDFRAFKSLRWTPIRRRRPVVVAPKLALDQVSMIDPPPPPPPPQASNSELIVSLKLKLLSAISGLNRGLVASEDDLRVADEAAKELELAGGPVDIFADLDKLQGRWKLLYSSAFSSRTLGGSRPGPPLGRLLPITLGQVFQRIDVISKDFDNIVELQLGAPWPLPPGEVTATLAHKFELKETSKIKIIFQQTTVKPTGNLSQIPPFELPKIPDALRPSSNTGSGEFEVTYIDSDTRITRGDRGELRVFVIC